MIEVKNLTKTYKTGNKALKGINIQIQDGEFVFIMGRSGSGKSTLLKLLLKELEPTSGQIIVNDMDLEKMPGRYIPKYRRRLGMVFQDFRLLKDKTVYENVAFAQRVIGVSSLRSRKMCRKCSGWWGFLQNIKHTRTSSRAVSSSVLRLPVR